ncbi:MAG TPA: DUF1631 family protein [Usitatibacter sp.]|nr:DUF1631 family protein [Usitatibacter sp.]
MVQNGKVVQLEAARARARLTPQESASALKGCRELALERMAGALSGMLDRVEDELFELAERATERDAQNVYLDARSQARTRRAAIESTFRQHFVEFFNLKVMGPPTGGIPASADAELELVDDDTLAARLAVDEMAGKMKSACEGELYALRERMGYLLERPDLEDDANPVSPATIFAALKDACDEIQSGFKERLALLRQLEGHAQPELQRIYRDMNALLVERKILPDFRIGARRNPPSRPAAAPGLPAATPAPQDLFGALSQLIGSAGGGASTGGGGGPVGVGGPGGPSVGPAPQAAFVAELTRMHRETVPAATGEAPVNVLKELRTSPQAAALEGVDATTIDIVAMLFDYVFDDPHIPASVKALLARLQIPTLKVALLDKSFFSSKAHPARRLLDLLAEASIGLDDAAAASAATLALIENVVDGVLHEFDTDLALFEAMATRVEAFMEERGRAEAELVQRSARLIEAREREEIARLVGEDEVTRRLLARVWVPAAVRDMLLETWTRAFAAVQLAEGEGSPAWHELVHTMDDLLWSVEPKGTPEDRKRLVVMLPAMLKQLHRGLVRGGLPEARRESFMGELVDCHAQAVKAGLRGLGALPEVPVPPVTENPRIERELLPVGDTQVEEIRLRVPRGGTIRNVFTRTGIWTNLQRGTWVEFKRAAGASTRARLTWISPNKGVYLFTNPASGAHALSISPEALAEQMRLGEAEVMDDASLVDRAVDSMLVGLRKERAH